jgi:hypothetical protein
MLAFQRNRAVAGDQENQQQPNKSATPQMNLTVRGPESTPDGAGAAHAWEATGAFFPHVVPQACVPCVVPARPRALALCGAAVARFHSAAVGS